VSKLGGSNKNGVSSKGSAPPTDLSETHVLGGDGAGVPTGGQMDTHAAFSKALKGIETRTCEAADKHGPALTFSFPILLGVCGEEGGAFSVSVVCRTAESGEEMNGHKTTRGERGRGGTSVYRVAARNRDGDN